MLRRDATPDYLDPKRFFANTYPTEGLKGLLANVSGRLSGKGAAISAVFRLDTSFGGGKTHGLIALVHAARGMRGVSNTEEFVNPAIVPTGSVRVAAFDGENADAANGRPMGDGVRAFTPWGEIAYPRRQPIQHTSKPSAIDSAGWCARRNRRQIPGSGGAVRIPGDRDH